MKTIQLILLATICLGVNSMASAEQFCSDVIQSSTPVERFTFNGATVTDKATGLTWQRCALGQTWDGSTCTGEPTGYGSWFEALNDAKAVGEGYRLANIKEYFSIVEDRCTSPAINLEIFPNFQAKGFNAFYWSSTPDVYDNNSVRIIDFQGGVLHTTQPYFTDKTFGTFGGGAMPKALAVKTAD